MTVLEQIQVELSERFEKATPARSPETLEKNPIGLEEEVAASLCIELDRHQASLFVLFHQYQKHHWLVEGPQFRDLHKYFQESYDAVHGDVDLIAERLTTLGGIPKSSPRALSEHSYIEHEAEGYFELRDMLENDLRAERAVCVTLRGSIGRAQEHGDFGTATLLKQVLLRAEDRAHHLDHYLAEDSLTPR